jgi:dienelactone hydrolase
MRPSGQTVRMTRRVALMVACGYVLAVGSDSQARQAGGPATAASLRADFLQLLERPRVPLAPSAPVQSVENGYAREGLSVASEAAERVPLVIVRREGAAGRRPVVIGLHGTGGSKDSMRSLLERYAAAGFVGVAMDARHHGERAVPIPGLSNPYESAMLRAYRTGEGRPYLYDTVWDVMRLVDYLVTRADVDPSRIGVIGNSKGGTEAYLAAAADPRIAAVIPLIGVQSFGWSLRHASGWEARVWTFRAAVEAAAADTGEAVNSAFVRKFYDRITPGLRDRFDGPAMLPLIAPRALLVINGDSDPRSPLGGVKEAVAAAEAAYAAANARDRFSFLLQTDAAHEVTAAAHDAALQWMTRWLSPPRSGS